MTLSYHTGVRGFPGSNIYITGSDGIVRGTVIPAMTLVDQTGASAGAGTTTSPTVVKSAGYTFLGQQQLTAPTAAAAALPTIPATATVAMVQNNSTQPYRFRYDGATTAPTATNGQRIAVGGVVTMDVGQATLLNVRVIQEAAATGTIDIAYFS